MKFDFSNVNFQYLMLIRDMAKNDPDVAATILGLPKNLLELLAEASNECLGQIAHIQSPLLSARGDVGWWSRFFWALADGSEEDIDLILEHASFAMLS